MDRQLELSVVVPAHNAAPFIARTLDALAASSIPRADWELIVVDDASSDDTPAIARKYTDHVIVTGETARGPAFARNRGAEIARGKIIAFIDADVIVKPDTLSRFVARLNEDSKRVAVFGAYDDEPDDKSLVSTYRNLLHHYAHIQSAGKVASFWAGCGAVIASAFRGAGGFDQDRFHKPQIEDIELGYRLRKHGDILLDPSIQGKHLKKWSALSMMRTDFSDRAVPWTRLLLASRGDRVEGNPSLGQRAIAATGLSALAIVFLVLAMIVRMPLLLVLAGISAALVIALNASFYAWLRAKGGWPLVSTAIPLHYGYHLLSAAAVPVGAAQYLMRNEPESITDPPRIFSAPYYERMRLLEAGSWWNAGMRDIAEQMLERANLPENGFLIDVGCGSGQTMSWFEHEHPEWKSAGIDVSIDGVNAARSAGLDVTLGDALSLPFSSGVADLIITLDVLQHLPFPAGDAQCIAECMRVLRPGGYLFIRTNCQSIPRATDDPANMFRKYDPDDLERKLTAAGFEVIALSRANAVLGFAEVARELRASRESGSGYHGLLAVPKEKRGLGYSAKRAMLRAEGKLISGGARLPAGRSIVALCRVPPISA